LLERQLGVAKSKLSDHEDAILVMEREKVDWAGRVDSVNRELRAERNRSEAVDGELKNLLAENRAMRQQADHAKAVAKIQDDEIALLRSRENKTIVEHVHVLEKAKKVTDRELAATKAERDQLSSVLRSMEQQKSRLIGDIEDMARQNELLRSEIRSVQKTTGPSLDDLNREKEARKKAEARAAQAIPQAEELNRLKAQSTKYQDNIAKLEKEVERSNNRSLPQSNEITRLQAQAAVDHEQVVKLQKDLSAVKVELERANALALKNTQSQHRTASGPSPSIKALQELHLGNEQLSKSMAEELRRNRLGPLAEANGRVRNENNRHSLDIGSMRTLMTTVPDDTGKLAAAQQKMARDLQLRKAIARYLDQSDCAYLLIATVQADLQTAQTVAKEAQKARTDAESRRAAVEKRLKDLQDNVSVKSLNENDTTRLTFRGKDG
jgi:myosin protein heavy chain